MTSAAKFGVVFTVSSAIIIAGFWPSFFSAPAQNDPIRTIHGFLATGWLIIVVAQPWLIASGRTRLHRAVGRVSIIWVTLLVASMIVTQFHMLSEPLGQGDALMARRAIGLVNFIGIPMFVILYGWGIRCAFKRDIDHHMRLMACTVAMTVPPGLVRLLITLNHGFGPIPMFGGFALVVLALAALLIRDRLAKRQVYGGNIFAIAGMAATPPLIPLIGSSESYVALLRMFGYPG